MTEREKIYKEEELKNYSQVPFDMTAYSKHIDEMNADHELIVKLKSGGNTNDM